MFFMDGLGNKIRILRYKKGWSQEIVAQKLGISITVLSQIENDEVDMFYKLLTKIALLFNIPLFLLLSVENTDFVIQPTELEQIETKVREHDQYIEELKTQLRNMKKSVN
jgi:transcriptional regulator with XRE-family HTH domain